MASEVVKFSQEQVDVIVQAAVVQATGMLNGQPAHWHNCDSAEGGRHVWFCASPYCEDVAQDRLRSCVNHGGTPPILKGREPWRGGNR